MKQLINLCLIIISLPLYSQIQVGQDIESGGGAGFSVDISNNGNRVIVGSPYFGPNWFSNDGKAAVYEMINGTWTQLGPDLSGTPGSQFGFNVSISGDGNTFAVSSYNPGSSDSGLVKVFQDSTGILVQKGQDISGDYIGWAVDISDDGNTLAVSSQYPIGFVRIYRWINSSWTQIGYDIIEPNAFTGYGIELSNDGNILAVGSARPADTGYVKTYSLLNDTINLFGNKIQKNNQNSGLFGYSLSFADQGQILAVGNFSAGSASVYQFTNNSWTQIGTDIIPTYFSLDFGFSVALSELGDIIAIGARHTSGSGIESGRTEIYHKSTVTNDWVFKAGINGEFAGDKSGYWVALSNSGDTVAIGAPNHSPDGQVRVFNIGMLGLPKIDNKLAVYPNPAKNLISIDLDQPFDFQIFDVRGSLVISGNSEGLIDLSNISSGNYLLLLDTPSGIISQIIEKL